MGPEAHGSINIDGCSHLDPRVSEALDCSRAAVRCAVRTAACHCGAFWRSELLQKSLRAKMAGRMLVSHSTLAVLNASGRLESQFSSKRRALCKVATA